MADITDNQPKLLMPLLVHILSGRSGSTLLMQLLGTSDEIVFDRIPPFEIRYLTYLARWASTLKIQVQPTNKWNFGTNFTEPGGLVGPLPSLEATHWDKEAMWQQALSSSWGQFSQAAIDKGKADILPKYYAEKSAPWLPAHIKGVLPYQVILLVRDPRDMFLSIIAFNKKRRYPGFDRRRWESDMKFARRWVKLVKQRANIARQELDTPYGILIKYEELISDLAGREHSKFVDEFAFCAVPGAGLFAKHRRGRRLELGD